MNLSVLKKIGWKHISVVIIAVLVFIGLDEKTAREYAPEIESVIETYIDIDEKDSSGQEAEGSLVVTKVYDGDTFTTASGERVRLVGIDAPEIGDAFSEESQDYLASLILDKEISVEYDTSGRDQYDRLLVYAYIDGVFVNEMMILKGLAEASVYYPDVAKQDVLEAAEKRAINDGVGIWSK